MKCIKVTLDKESLEMKVDAVGFKGGECVHALDKLTHALHLQTIHRRPKLEAFGGREKYIIKQRR